MARVLSVRVSFKGQELSSRTFQSDSISIGRDADCDIRLDNVGVSRRHACIDRQGPGYLLRDLSSSNGTVVGDKPIKAWPIRDGDHARIAKFDLEFHLGAEVPETQGDSRALAPILRERDTMIASEERIPLSPAATVPASGAKQHSPWRRPMVWIVTAALFAAAGGILILKGS